MLLAMQRNENAAWEEFLEFYDPLITLRANDYRLTLQETDELRQDICVSIFTKNSLAAYDPTRAILAAYQDRLLHAAYVTAILLKTD